MHNTQAQVRQGAPRAARGLSPSSSRSVPLPGVFLRGAEKMNAELERKLTRIQNRPTLYEVVVEHVENPADGPRFLLCYTDRWTRRAIIESVSKRAREIYLATKVEDEDWKFGSHVRDPITGTDADGVEWQIRKSGRTQRDAFCNGELTWIVDAVADEEVA